LGWHLEEIHVTWANLGRNGTRLQLYTKRLEEFLTDYRDGVRISSDVVWIYKQWCQSSCDGVRT
ncbi:hypothetical protein Tco_0129913, partial [Tanacetum coccineum]